MDGVPSGFDRVLGALTGLPDTSMTRPSTILEAHQMLPELNATYVVQSAKQRDTGFTIFLQVVDAEGARKIVIPPKVAAAIYRQRQSLTDRSTPESRAKKRAARERAKARAAKEARRRARAGGE